MTTEGFWAVTAERSCSRATKNSSPSSDQIQMNDLLGCQPCSMATPMLTGRGSS